MSLRRAVFALFAAAFVAAIPQVTVAAPTEVSSPPAVSSSDWLPAFLDWLGDRLPLGSIVGKDAAAPGLGPDDPSSAVLLDPDDPAVFSDDPQTGPPDGEIGPGLDPNG